MPIATASLNQKIFVRPSEVDQYRPEEGWFPINNKPRVITSMDGRQVAIQGQKARYLPLLSCERILKVALALLCTIASLGLALASKTIRRCFSGYQEVKVVQEFSHFRRPPPSRPSKSDERKSGTEEDLRSSCPLSGAAAERLRVFSETKTKAAPNLWQHYNQALTQYSRSSPDVQSEILAVYIRDYTFESNKGVSLEEFRVRFGPPPPLGKGSDILAWNNITQYAFQILRERQGDLSEQLMDAILVQLEAFLKEYLTKYFEIHGLGGPEHRKERIKVVAKKRRAENVLWGKYGSFLVDHLGQPVNTPFPLGDSPYRDAFSECTSREFISRIWLFTQTYFEAKNPLRGTRGIQDALVTALSYSESPYNGAIACHQGKCDQITVEVLNSRLNGVGQGDLTLPAEELVKRAVDEFFNDPHQGEQHRNILIKEIAFSATIQEKILTEARLWYKEKSIAVDQEAFEAELLQYAKDFYGR